MKFEMPEGTYDLLLFCGSLALATLVILFVLLLKEDKSNTKIICKSCPGSSVCSNSNICVQCIIDKDCDTLLTTSVCDPVSNKCIQCLKNDDCPDSTPVCSNSKCYQCNVGLSNECQTWGTYSIIPGVDITCILPFGICTEGNICRLTAIEILNYSKPESQAIVTVSSATQDFAVFNIGKGSQTLIAQAQSQLSGKNEECLAAIFNYDDNKLGPLVKCLKSGDKVYANKQQNNILIMMSDGQMQNEKPGENKTKSLKGPKQSFYAEMYQNN